MSLCIDFAQLSRIQLEMDHPARVWRERNALQAFKAAQRVALT